MNGYANSMRDGYFEYLRKQKKEQEAKKSEKLGILGFTVGAAYALEDEENNLDDVLCYGVLGVIGAAIIEKVLPKTSNLIKSLL